MASCSRQVGALRSASTVAVPSTVAVARTAELDLGATRATDASTARTGVLPNGRKYVLYNGVKYPLDWKSEWEEGGAEKIDRWVKEGKWCAIEHRPMYFLPNTFEKKKIWQMYYELNQDKPMYNTGHLMDRAQWDITKGLFLIACIMCVVNMYYLVAPESMTARYKADKSRSFFGQENAYK